MILQVFLSITSSFRNLRSKKHRAQQNHQQSSTESSCKLKGRGVLRALMETGWSSPLGNKDNEGVHIMQSRVGSFSQICVSSFFVASEDRKVEYYFWSWHWLEKYPGHSCGPQSSNMKETTLKSSFWTVYKDMYKVMLSHCYPCVYVVPQFANATEVASLSQTSISYHSYRMGIQILWHGNEWDLISYVLHSVLLNWREFVSSSIPTIFVTA